MIYDVALSHCRQKDINAEALYDLQRQQLKGTCVPVDYKKEKEVITWVICDLTENECAQCSS